MRLVEIAPGPCTNCGKGNGVDRQGDRLRFVDLERDINWNDPVVLCEECTMKIGGLVGMLSQDTLKDLQRTVAKAQQEIHDTKAEMDEMRSRAKKMGIEFVPQT
jgi:hypothetical protein